MQRNMLTLLTTALLLMVLMSCSSEHNDNGTLPLVNDPDISAESQRELLGVWRLKPDLDDQATKVEFARDLAAHYDITQQVPAPTVSNESYDGNTQIYQVDLTINNTGLGWDAFDVRLIVFTDNDGTELKNPDNWSALYDMPGGSFINPFKAYATGEPSRRFANAASHTETVSIYLPGGILYSNIVLAIDASIPSNCEEPYLINNFTQETLGFSVGSNAIITVDVYDWQADIDSVKLHCPAITGNPTDYFSFDSGNTWSLNLVNNSGVAAGIYLAMISATSTGSGDLELYDVLTIAVASFEWAKTWGGTGADYGNGVAVDGSGNIYVVGCFQGTVDLDPSLGEDWHTVVSHTSNVYLSKFDSNGDFQWALTWDAYGASGVAVDNSGNVYVAGGWGYNVVDFDPGLGGDWHTPYGHTDFFLSKFDSNGNFQWALTWGGTEVEYAGGVVVDGSDNVYFAGGFCATVDFDPGPGTDYQSAGAWRAFCLSKFDSNGNYQWARIWGGGFNWHNYPSGLTADDSGNAYVVGHFYGNVDFDPGPGTDYHSPNGDFDACLSKFDSNGDFRWAHTWGGSDGDSANGVAAYDPDNIYVTSDFRGTVDLDPSVGVDWHTSNGESDASLSKFDSNGDFQWARTWGGIAGDNARRVAMIDSGNIYVIGSFRVTADFDPGPGTDDHTSNGEIDIFLSKFNSNGDFQWACTWGGIVNDGGYEVATYNLDIIYVTGYFQETVDFDPGPGVDEHTSNGGFDAFLWKGND